MSLIRDLMRTHRSAGRVTWIGVRPERLSDMHVLAEVEATLEGLGGDHFRAGGKRAVTLLQAEHLPVISALAQVSVTPEQLRRNIVVAGINLTALRNHPIRLGGAILKVSGPCAPCSRMEKTIGTGGYNAMRGHGGWYAEVLSPGKIALSDAVIPDRSE